MTATWNCGQARKWLASHHHDEVLESRLRNIVVVRSGFCAKLQQKIKKPYLIHRPSLQKGEPLAVALVGGSFGVAAFERTPLVQALRSADPPRCVEPLGENPWDGMLGNPSQIKVFVLAHNLLPYDSNNLSKFNSNWDQRRIRRRRPASLVVRSSPRASLINLAFSIDFSPRPPPNKP